MDPISEPKPTSARWGWAGSLLVLALAVLAYLRPPDGTERAALAQFFGRFHPLIIHLPIGMILLAAVLEAASWCRRWSYLRPAIGFVLVLATLTTLASAADGWLLAWSGAYRGALVIRHMWAGLWLAAFCLATTLLRSSAARRGKGPGLYRAGLLATLGLLGWACHAGGSITHGSGYLTDEMPPRLRSWLGAPAPRPKAAAAATAAGPNTFYGAKLAPLFDRSCVSCHGPKKIKGGFRLDTYAQLMQGGDDGSAVEPWYPQKSEIIRRLTLDPDDDDYMPSGGKKPFSPVEVKLLQQWIAAGASEKEPADAVTASPVVSP